MIEGRKDIAFSRVPFMVCVYTFFIVVSS